MACCYLIKIYFKNWGRTNQSTAVVQNSYEWVTWACTASKCMSAETDPLGWWKGLRVQQCLVKINQVQSLTYESVAALSVHWLRPTVYVGDGINRCELPLQFRYTVTLRHDFPQVMVHSRNIQFSHMQYCLVSCTHLCVSSSTCYLLCSPAEILLSLQLFLSMAQTQKVALVDV